MSVAGFALERLDRWIGSFRARRRVASGVVGVWYDPLYIPFDPEGAEAGAATSSRRGDLVMGRLAHDGFIEPSAVRNPKPVDVDDVASFHSWAYIESTGRPETLARIYGVVPEMIDVERLLSSARTVVGGTVEAAEAVVTTGLRVGLNLGGGFHHAEPEAGSGFCVYNDVGIAIRRLRAAGFTERIGIIDLDVHQGNGNTVAFGPNDGVSVYSIHGSRWNRMECPHHQEIHLRSRPDDSRYLAVLRTTLPSFLDRHRPELVFYVAGADVLAEDRLGTFGLTLEGVFRRDRMVTEWVRDLGAGLVVTLGGGYSSSAWVAHYNHARFLLSGSARVTELRGRGNALEKSFERVARALDERDLRGDVLDLSIDERDLFGQLSAQPRAHRFLDYYSDEGVRIALERYGIYQALRERGFSNLETHLDASNPERQVIAVDGDKDDETHRLLELVARKRLIEVEGRRFSALHVEWLLLQDPTASFTLDRPRLPGQEHPGLGLVMVMTEMLKRACLRLSLAGITHRPAHYHNAQGAPQSFRFIDPADEGLRRAMGVVLSGLTIAEASRLVDEGHVKLADGTPVRWEVKEHVLPLDPELQAIFRSEDYRGRVTEATRYWLQRGLHPEIEADGAVPVAES
ncbi:MAG TPA: hypothetical protein RMG48_03060 [Myxococcales bacterium LLY-WYZ-16_1]|nr:hypothetical protein [Myxococcales bacterium LLY-WYZ-16_1]